MGWQPRSGDPFGAASAATPPRHDPSAPDTRGDESDQPTTIRPVVATADTAPVRSADPVDRSRTAAAGSETGYPWPVQPGGDPADAVPTVLEAGPAESKPASAGAQNSGSQNSGPQNIGSQNIGSQNIGPQNIGSQNSVDTSTFSGFAGGLFDDNVITDDTRTERQPPARPEPVPATLVQPTAPAPMPDVPPQPASRSSSAGGASVRDRPTPVPRPLPWFITRTTVGLSAGILGLFVGLLLIPAVAAPPPAPVVQTVVQTATATATSTATTTATATSTTTATATATQTVTAQTPVAPIGGECPAAAPIKGDQTSMTFFPQNSQYYNQVQATHCFASSADATAAGFNPAPE